MGYSYLDNTVAGGLLQPQQSVPGNYVPGQGTAPYGTQGLQQAVGGALSGAQQSFIPGLQQAVQGAMVGGQIDYPRLQRQLGLTNEQMQRMISSGAVSGAQGTPVNSFTSQPQSGINTTGTTGNEPSGILGLNSPYQQATDARNAAIMGSPVGGGTQGGGGGMAGGSGSSGGMTNSNGTGSGGLLAGGPPTSPSSPASGSFPGMSFPNGAPIGYQQPGQTQGGQPGQATVPMQQASGQDAMNSYLQTTGNQLLGDPSYQRYQQSPGYQFAVDEAMKQIQRSGASRGLLESGSTMNAMIDRAQGMAQQDYGNWWNRQNQLFGDYQNRLAGLAGGDTGAQNAMQTGTNLGAGSMQMGSNLGSLFGNQGSNVFGAITNTGAALSNSIQQAGNQQAQINSANQATRLAGATSGFF